MAIGVGVVVGLAIMVAVYLLVVRGSPPKPQRNEKAAGSAGLLPSSAPSAQAPGNSPAPSDPAPAPSAPGNDALLDAGADAAPLDAGARSKESRGAPSQPTIYDEQLDASTAEAEAPPPPPPPAGPFNRAEAEQVLRSIGGYVHQCRRPGDPGGTGKARVSFFRDGSVLSVALELPGSLGSQPIAQCISRTFRAARVSPFSGELPTVVQSFRF